MNNFNVGIISEMNKEAMHPAIVRALVGAGMGTAGGALYGGISAGGGGAVGKYIGDDPWSPFAALTVGGIPGVLAQQSDLSGLQGLGYGALYGGGLGALAGAGIGAYLR